MTILFVEITTYVDVKKSIHDEMNITFFIFPQYQNYNPTAWVRRTQSIKSADLFYNNEEFYFEGI